MILLYTNIHISVTQCHTCISAYIERGREKKRQIEEANIRAFLFLGGWLVEMSSYFNEIAGSAGASYKLYAS